VAPAIRPTATAETTWQEHGTVVASWLDTAGSLMIPGFAVLFVVWFRRARINAERHGYRQRRARGWTFWGWFVPIVSLWFPFQLMGDIWRAGLPAERRGRTAWLPALWWTCCADRTRQGVPAVVANQAGRSRGLRPQDHGEYVVVLVAAPVAR
jgi:uncharacterized protein DUF4328